MDSYPCATDVEGMTKVLEGWKRSRHRHTVGITPLHIAAYSAPPHILQFVYDQVGGLEEQDKYGSTPIQCAAVGGNIDAIETLHAMGAHIGHKDQRGRTAAHYAIIYGNYDAMRLLVLLDSSVLYSRARSGKTLLMYVEKTRRGEREKMFEFLHKAAPEMLDAVDDNGLTALHYAMAVRNASAVERYRQAGSRAFNARSNNGSTPLHCAAEVNCLDAIAALQRCGCDIDAQRDDGNTAMHIAARKLFNVELMTSLVKLGSCAYWIPNNIGEFPYTWLLSDARACIEKSLSLRSMLENVRMADKILQLSRKSTPVVHFEK